VLGGGVGSNADLLLPRVRDRLGATLARPPAVAVSQLGVRAVLAGAVATGVLSAREVAFDGAAART